MSNLISTPSEHSANPHSKRVVATIFSALLLALLAFVPAFLSATTADAASTKRIELGRGNLALNPNCGKNFERDCVAEGKVTAFQALSAKSPGRNFVVPYAGKVISWTIKLADPTRKDFTEGANTFPSQVAGFNGVFGSPSQARIAVLKQVEKKKKGGPRYKMVRQSPVQVLNPYFGTTVRFALSEPLNVIKGQVIGLTIPTWVPALWKSYACQPVSSDAVVDATRCAADEAKYTWRGSRAPDKCALGRDTETGDPNEALQKTRPQQKVDSVKRYGCYYGANVLTYSATIVAK